MHRSLAAHLDSIPMAVRIRFGCKKHIITFASIIMHDYFFTTIQWGRHPAVKISRSPIVRGHQEKTGTVQVGSFSFSSGYGRGLQIICTS